MARIYLFFWCVYLVSWVFRLGDGVEKNHEVTSKTPWKVLWITWIVIFRSSTAEPRWITMFQGLSLMWWAGSFSSKDFVSTFGSVFSCELPVFLLDNVVWEFCYDETISIVLPVNAILHSVFPVWLWVYNFRDDEQTLTHTDAKTSGKNTRLGLQDRFLWLEGFLAVYGMYLSNSHSFDNTVNQTGERWCVFWMIGGGFLQMFWNFHRTNITLTCP